MRDLSRTEEVDTMTLSSDPDYAFTAMSGVGAAVLLFQVRYSRLIALLMVPMLAILEDPFFLIFGLLWFGPLIFLPALAYDEFDTEPPVWSLDLGRRMRDCVADIVHFVQYHGYGTFRILRPNWVSRL